VLADHVYETLMTSLVDGRLAAGESLNIGALSRELEMSQTPIREALARLESTGLVVREALRGYRVAPLFSPEELAELMEARIALEPHLARMAGVAGSGELVTELRFPGGGTTAVLLGAVTIYGLQPGPLLFETQPTLIWGLLVSFFIGNVLLLVLNLPLAPVFGQTLRIPYGYRYPIILLTSFVGAYAVRTTSFSA
jgi:biotin operon repressor